MTIMDFKGITWTGMCRKFEALCSEVEEIIVQDTVKYVENQVQTVGASVKKFYSDVVQDLTPPSAEDLGKVTTSSIIKEGQYVPAFTFDKANKDTNEVASVVDGDKWTTDSYVTTCEKKGGHGGTYGKRSKLGAKRISRKDSLSPVITHGKDGHTTKDLSRASALHIPSGKGDEQSCDLKTISADLTSIEATRFNSTEETSEENRCPSDCVPELFTETSVSNTISMIKSTGSVEPEIKQSHLGSLSAESSAPANSMSHGMGSQAASSIKDDTEMQHDDSIDRVVSTSNLDCAEHADETTTDTSEMASAVEHEKDIAVDLSRKSMEESCIFVNVDELDFIPNKDGKRRLQKKKIRDTISSRMRSARKHEYRQLAAQWSGEVNESNQVSVRSPKQSHKNQNVNTSHAYDASESDWELL